MSQYEEGKKKKERKERKEEGYYEGYHGTGEKVITWAGKRVMGFPHKMENNYFPIMSQEQLDGALISP